jgi:intergrase/recombinase
LRRADRLAWLGHWLYEPKVAGSSPARPTFYSLNRPDYKFLPGNNFLLSGNENLLPQPSKIDWNNFKEFVEERYSKNSVASIVSYARRHAHILSEVHKLELVPESRRTHVVKALLILARYLGLIDQFKAALKAFGFKWKRSDVITAFARIYCNHNNDLNEWVVEINKILRPNERLFVKYVKLSGLRKSEALESFNLIIALSRQNKLSDYINPDNGIIEHFRFKQFLRGTKNAFISIVPDSLIAEIAQSSPVTSPQIIKKLQKAGMKSRINELRDYYGTWLVRHGVIKEEQDLICGRISQSIFVRCYFSPAINDLKARVLSAVAKMELNGNA